jgi:hypothetical protein
MVDKLDDASGQSPDVNREDDAHCVGLHLKILYREWHKRKPGPF